MNEFRLFFHYAARHKYSYLLGVFALFVTNWLAVNIPVNIGASIDLLSGSISDNYSSLLRHIYTVIGFAICMIIARTLSRMFFFNPGRAVERELKNDALEKLMALQKSFYDKHQTGALISIINNDINGVRAMAGVGTMQVFNICFALSLTPMKMWQISPILTLYCIAPVLIAFVIVNYSIAYMRRLVVVRMQKLQALSSNTLNALSGVEVIKNHHIQSWAIDEFEQDNQNMLETSLKQLWVRTFFLPILDYTDGILKILILGMGGYFVIQSSISIGDLTAFLAYATLLAMPFISLGRIISTFQMGWVSLKSIQRIIGQTLINLPKLDASEKEVIFSQGICVKNLNYAYPNTGNSEVARTANDENEIQQHTSTPVLKNISFNIFPGQKIALLGKVGSGKTTLVNCLNGYLEIDPGHIFIDDKDITSLAYEDIRSVVRTITQEPFLFSDSVANNIQFGSQTYNSKKNDKLTIEQALYQSDMLDEVTQFPQAEQTMVGEKGILLSGGQKQRLSLARGMFTPCKLIVLDNVLSAVDNNTERFLLNQIFEEMRSQSSFIVSHRPAVLERVDQILLLDNGEIIARGDHKTLLASSKVYRASWQMMHKERHAGVNA